MSVPMQHYFQEKFKECGKRERTRGILADGIIHLVCEGGGEALSARRVAAVTGLSVGTVYNHFKNMDDALEFAAECIILETVHAADEATKDLTNAAEIFVTATRLVLDRVLDNSGWGIVIKTSVLKSKKIRVDAFQGLERDVMLGLKQGVFKADPSPLLFFQLAEMVWSGIRFQVAFGESEQAKREVCEATLRMLGVDYETAKKVVSNQSP